MNKDLLIKERLNQMKSSLVLHPDQLSVDLKHYGEDSVRLGKTDPYPYTVVPMTWIYHQNKMSPREESCHSQGATVP